MAHNIPHSKESKEKMSITLKEKWKSPDFREKMKMNSNKIGAWNKGLKCPWTTKRNLENNPSKGGDKHWNWKGGVSRGWKTGYYSTGYKKWRQDVFKRDEYTCQECGDIGYITAHHIKSWSKYSELRYDVSNGITLCEKCHSKTDNYKGRANRI